jgi:hypothetical protein
MTTFQDNKSAVLSLLQQSKQELSITEIQSKLNGLDNYLSRYELHLILKTFVQDGLLLRRNHGESYFQTSANT